jgi:CP family cyanate transporter-like MFS transporter
VWYSVLVCALLVLVGINLRSVILAVPPVLPLIRRDIGLNYTETGLLTSLPTLIMGGAAWMSGLVVERIGARNAVMWGLALLGAGALLRAVWSAALPLFFFTIVLGLGIALGQTTAPVLVRRWFPGHIGLVTALFTDGLILGETLGAGATVPLMLWLLGNDAWRATFVLWGLPVVVLLAFWLWLAPREPQKEHERLAGQDLVAGPVELQGPASLPAPVEAEKAPVRTIHLGLLLGSGSLIYFGMNGWIATYNQALGRGSLTPLALTILNALQLPSSLGVTFFAQRLAGKRWPFVASGIVCVIAILAWIFGPASLEYPCAALLGASSALVFTLGLALPALLARPNKVARLAGATLSISYSTAFIGPFIGGGLWDLSGQPGMAFAPVAAASVVLVVAGVMLPVYSARPVGG